MNLEDLLKNPPLLHQSESGEATTWKLTDDVLHFIHDNVNQYSHTLETGSGLSTIVFGLRSTNHNCIVPNQTEVNRIKQYCNENKILIDKIHFHLNGSEQILPKLEMNDLDLVLVDGRHAFPTPFIDWYYTASKLKVGGIMLIDDTQIFTGALLKKFLLSEPEWSLIRNFVSKTAAFVKVKEYNHSKTWLEQPYVIRNSKYSIQISKIQTALTFLSKGDFSTLTQKLIENFRAK